ASTARGPVLNRLLVTERTDAVPERPGEGHGHERGDRDVDAVELLTDEVPVLRQPESGVRERPAPGQRSREREPDEGPELHARHARGQSDEGANDRQEPRPEDRLPSPAGEPAVGERELARREQ